MTKPDMDAAAQFLAANARVLDLRRFERILGGGGPEPVRDAIAAFRNDDGGFGHGLEPDGRDPASQPTAIEQALHTLDQADAWDGELVAGACRWLQAHAPQEGGAAFVEETIAGWPHAPWWVPEPGRPASLITTGLIAGTLHARQVSHPWLDRATDLMWDRIGSLSTPGPYDMRGILHFLDHVPDADRARSALRTAGALLTELNLVAVEPGTPGEVMTPLDYAPFPGLLSRELFSEPTIQAHLDHLAASQRDDGGWMSNWAAWSPAAEREWRGSLTVDALHVLRRNGRC